MKERQICQMEAERFSVSDAYFKARDALYGEESERKIFEDGFDRGYRAAIKNESATEQEADGENR